MCITDMSAHGGSDARDESANESPPDAGRVGGDGGGRLASAARRALDEARASVRALEELHARGLRAAMAVELAPWLAAGRPCDVCGSPTHPSPARVRPDLDASRRALAAAERLAAACEAMVEALPAGASAVDRADRPVPDSAPGTGRTLH